MERNGSTASTLRRKAALGISIVAVVAAVGCGSSASDEDNSALPTTTAESNSTTSAPDSSVPTTTVPTTTTTTTTTDAPRQDLDLVGRGPYEVGVLTITVDDGERDRPLMVDVWFPLPAGTPGDPHQYTFLPGIYYESPEALVAEPEAISGDGPFPLVVYSHGSGGLRYVHSNYTETIASHGYIVAAPDHTGNTTVDLILSSSDDPAVIALNRPQDVAAVLDELLDPSSAAAPGIVEHIDPERIAVTGHSFGGFTSFATIAGFDNQNGSIEGDERVDGIVVLAPAASELLLTDERLQAVDVPFMMIVGTDDKTTPIDPNVTRPWELAPGLPKYRVELEAAEHQTFTDICDYVTFLPTLDVVPDVITDTIDEFALAGCQPDDMPSDRAQALTNTFAITFLDELFRGSAAIDPNITEIPADVTYLVETG